MGKRSFYQSGSEEAFYLGRHFISKLQHPVTKELHANLLALLEAPWALCSTNRPISSFDRSPFGFTPTSRRQQDHLLMAHHRSDLCMCCPDLSAAVILQFCQLFAESSSTWPLRQTLQLCLVPRRHFTTCVFICLLLSLGIPWPFSLTSGKLMLKWWKHTCVWTDVTT